MDLTPKAQVTKEKKKLDLIKIKIFCAPQDTIHRVIRQAIEWENICANHRAEKGFISRIYREPLKLTDWLKKGQRI